MKKSLVAAGTGLAGVLAAGLTVSVFAFPADADEDAKREENTSEVVLVEENDDDDDLTGKDLVTDTNTRDDTKDDTNTRDDTRTGIDG